MTDSKENNIQSETDPHHGDDHSHAEHGRGEHEHEFQSLRTAFTERAIALGTMDRRLRLMTGLAIVQIIVVALLIPLREAHLTMLPVYIVDTHLVQSPVVVYSAAIALLSLAWGYLLAGVFQGHPILRLLGLVIFTWVIELIHPSLPPQAIEVTWDALLAVPWLVGLWSVWRDLRQPPWRRSRQIVSRPLDWYVILPIPIATLGIYGLSFLGDHHNGSTLLFTEKVTSQLSSIQFALIPILFLAGVDFAEWGAMTMERIATLVQGTRSPVAALLAAATSALVVLAIIVSTYGHALFVGHHPMPLIGAGILGLLLLGLLGVLFWAIRLGNGLPLHLPYRSLVIATFLFSVPTFALSAISTNLATQGASNAIRAHPWTFKTTTYTHEHGYPFTIEYPQTWAVTPFVDVGEKKILWLLFNGLPAGNPALLYLIAASATAEPTFVKTRSDWTSATAHAATFTYNDPATVGLWQTIHYNEYKAGKLMVTGRMWYRHTGKLAYFMQDQTNSHLEAFEASTFENMALSFKPTVPGKTGTPDTTASANDGLSSDALLSIVAGLLTLVGILSAALLIRRVHSGRLGSVSTGLLFLTVFCSYVFIASLHSLSATLLARFGALGNLPIMSIIGVQIACAIVTLVGVAWALATDRVTPRGGNLALLALALNGALQVVAWIYDLFTQAMSVSGRLSLAAAAIVIIALLWDVVMSGEAITNVEGAVFPRSSRVLMFFGYMILTGVNVAYFATLQVQATGENVEAQFESDRWVQNGLLTLGMPLLLTLFLLKVGRWQRGAQDERRVEPGRPSSHPAAALPADGGQATPLPLHPQ